VEKENVLIKIGGATGIFSVAFFLSAEKSYVQRIQAAVASGPQCLLEKSGIEW
jgi:hypothetical protein